MHLCTAKQSVITCILVYIFTCAVVNRADASGCSTSELNTMNTTIEQIYQASMYGQLEKVIRLTQELNSSLSPGCQQALQAMGQGGYGNYGGYGGNQGYGGYQGGNVYDHGGGAYSTGGVYCGPSGCY